MHMKVLAMEMETENQFVLWNLKALIFRMKNFIMLCFLISRPNSYKMGVGHRKHAFHTLLKKLDSAEILQSWFVLFIYIFWKKLP